MSAMPTTGHLFPSATSSIATHRRRPRRIFARSLSLGGRLLPGGRPLAAALAGGRSSYRETRLSGEPIREFVAPVADSGGQFNLTNLQPGRYIVYATADENNDRRRGLREAYDSVEVTLDSSSNVALFAFPHDTVPPRPRTATYVDSMSVRVEFSQALDPAKSLDTTHVQEGDSPHGENDRKCQHGRMQGLRKSHADRQHAGGDRADHGDDLDDAGEASDEEPVRQPDRPEQKRERRRDDEDDQGHAAHVCAELEVDQQPRVANDLSLRAREQLGHHLHRALTLEDPVAGDREHEEDPDRDLERRHPDRLRRRE